MNNIKIDFINNTLIVTKAFYTEACKYGTDEYAEGWKCLSGILSGFWIV